MTTQEAREAKEKAESQILEIIKNLQKETGCNVEAINLQSELTQFSIFSMPLLVSIDLVIP